MRISHRWLGHISYRAVHAIASGEITGIEIDKNSEEEFCDACTGAKIHRAPFPDQASNRATEFGERIHADLWGPAQVQSLGGNKYAVDFTDDATRWTEDDYLKTKDQTQAAYERMEMRLKTQSNIQIKILRTDRGTEFSNKKFDQHLAEKGTVRELTVHDTHEQVGVAERLNRTKVELARAMLLDSKLLRFLWAEAMSHAIWIKNRSPTRALNGKTPYATKFGKKPDMSNLVPFGTRTWVKKAKSGKLESRWIPDLLPRRKGG